MDLHNKINDLLEAIQERQAARRKLLKVDDFETQVISEIGNARTYHQLGGYPVFWQCISELIENGKLMKLSESKTNGKNPPLHQRYWLLPKYAENQWKKEEIAKMMGCLDLSFYLNNKKHQTEEDWRFINRIYQFLISSNEESLVINREERSQMLFRNEKCPNDIEAEKFLSSPEGSRLLNRLKLTEKELKYKIVREPFHYWENKKAPETHNQEVIIVEGLATYNTLKEILTLELPWNFGPIPRYLIWGEGYRIERTIDYLNEIADNPKDLIIRYVGDMDYEGYNIFVNLKQKNWDLNISLAHAFYSFLAFQAEEFSTSVFTKQRIVESYLPVLKAEFEGYEEVYLAIEELWRNNKRIAQECLNFETIYQKGGFY
ncbi:hypothetical protein FIU87_03385 [Bacillus sp. THAF10]|uniref:Wadjet anti-phage system protein JetD domain-containing protein n=1 Tax=Bacillus sp. THAF10 TaxID=2587848 RepID=UPI001268D26D|nr:Wadjet anti-phage system protein JetD domain-containing protein [Bacillus sp. THAF10]QFT87685.1 hypothetical protein FIU87_03385 [Bacillus sp. THAF10]